MNTKKNSPQPSSINTGSIENLIKVYKLHLNLSQEAECIIKIYSDQSVSKRRFHSFLSSSFLSLPLALGSKKSKTFSQSSLRPFLNQSFFISSLIRSNKRSHSLPFTI